MAIRYSKNGEIEIYDKKTGITTGHISTMGNMNEETEEDKKRNKEAYEKAMRENGLKPY